MKRHYLSLIYLQCRCSYVCASGRMFCGYVCTESTGQPYMFLWSQLSCFIVWFGFFGFFFKRGTYSYSGMKVAKQAKLWPSEIQRSIVPTFLLLRLQTPRHLAQPFKRVLGTGLRSSCLHSKT